MKQKVVYLRFHSADTHVPGVPSFGTSLPCNTKTFETEMYYTEGSNVIEARLNRIDVRIPLSSIQMFIMESDSGPKAVKLSKVV